MQRRYEFSKRWLPILVTMISSTVAIRPASGAVANLRDALKPLAQNIVDVVEKDQHQHAIAVGDFSPPPRFDANAGPGISESLTALLEELRPGFVKKDAELSVRGRYDRSPDPKAPELLMIKVTAEITNDKGFAIDSKFAEIRDTGVAADLLGATVSLPPAGTREKRNQELQKALKGPEYNQTIGDPPSTIIKTRPGSAFGIEILVTSKENAPSEAKDWDRVPARTPSNKSGQPFVDIQRDEVYAIRIHDDFEFKGTRHEAAAAVTIDGIDVFSFSEIRDPKTKNPKYSHYIVPPGQSIIPGWHKTNEHSDTFLVTEYGMGGASRAPKRSRGKVGTITVRFALAWIGAKIPDAEKGAREASNETGFGPPTRTELNEVARQVGTVRDVISVRYTR